MKRWVLVSIASCSLLFAATSDAQPTRDPVGAEALFNSAMALLDKGDWPAACAKLQASQELDPAVSTLVKLAQCKEHEGKLAEAWYLLQEAYKLNRAKEDQQAKRRQELEAYTSKLLAEIEPRVPKLRVVISNAPDGMKVSRDGAEIPLSTLGQSLPANPGAHSILVEARGFVTARRSFTLAEGQALDVSIDLQRETARPVPAPAYTTVDTPIAEASHGASRRTIGFVLGGVGVAGLLTAGVLGGVTLAKVGAAAPDESGNDARAAARSTQTAAFIASGVGVAALGTGIIVIVSAPKSSTPVAFRFGPGSASVRAAF